MQLVPIYHHLKKLLSSYVATLGEEQTLRTVVRSCKALEIPIGYSNDSGDIKHVGMSLPANQSTKQLISWYSEHIFENPDDVLKRNLTNSTNAAAQTPKNEMPSHFLIPGQSGKGASPTPHQSTLRTQNSCIYRKKKLAKARAQSGLRKTPKNPTSTELYSTNLNPSSIPHRQPLQPYHLRRTNRIWKYIITKSTGGGGGDLLSRAQGCRRLGGEYSSGRSRPQFPRASAGWREREWGGGGGAEREGQKETGCGVTREYWNQNPSSRYLDFLLLVMRWEGKQGRGLAG